jgi:hypothetical protein
MLISWAQQEIKGASSKSRAWRIATCAKHPAQHKHAYSRVGRIWVNHRACCAHDKNRGHPAEFTWENMWENVERTWVGTWDSVSTNTIRTHTQQFALQAHCDYNTEHSTSSLAKNSLRWEAKSVYASKWEREQQRNENVVFKGHSKHIQNRYANLENRMACTQRVDRNHGVGVPTTNI